MTRHDWVAKVTHGEFCKKFKFDLPNKCYIHDPESALETEMHKLLGDFELRTHHLILAKRPELVIVYRKRKPAKTNRPQSKIERQKERLVSRPRKRAIKTTMEHENDGDTNCNWRYCFSHRRIGKGTGRLGNGRTSRDHPNYSIIGIG